MITRQLLLIGTALCLAISTAIFGIWRASTTRRDLQILTEEGLRLDAQVQQLTRARDESVNQLALEKEENQRLASDHTNSLKRRKELSRPATESPENGSADPISGSWPGRVSQLKQCLVLNPEARIPEMQLLDEEDWLTVVKDLPMQTEADYRRALSALRSRAEGNLIPEIQKALIAFKKANNGQTPTDITMLYPHLDPRIDPAILVRWAIVPRDSIPMELDADFVVTQMSAVVDPEMDYVKIVGPNMTAGISFQ